MKCILKELLEHSMDDIECVIVQGPDSIYIAFAGDSPLLVSREDYVAFCEQIKLVDVMKATVLLHALRKVW